MQAPKTVLRNLSHWGAFRATVTEGKLTRVTPFEHDPEPNPMIDAWVEMIDSPLRVARPSIRQGFLAKDGGAGRGHDAFVTLPWDEALDLVAEALARIRRDHGPHAVFGGSYGWSSAGRLHHARSLIRRFMNVTGGHTDQENNYSYGAAMVFLPRILGRRDMVGGQLTQTDTIREHTDMLLAFGGLPRRTWANQSGGAGAHGYDAFISAIGTRARIFNISPNAGDIAADIPHDWLSLRPGSDTALMLALAQEIVAAGGADADFLAQYTHGSAVVMDYLSGKSDGIAKTARWAAPLTGLSADSIRALAHSLIGKRVLLTATWSLQRAQNGEQPYWAMVTLAAVLGQIGLPGGGFAFGYGSSGGMGNPNYAPPLYALPIGENPARSTIPVARVADMLLNPGGSYRYNGSTRHYPDVKMVYWAGGNPFMHHQDLNRLAQAFKRPEMVVVNECFWTATARHADIVLPATTTLERNDIGGSSRDPYLLAMHQLVAPIGDARNDFDIFADLAERLGKRVAFTLGLDEDGLLARAWEHIRPRLVARGLPDISLEDFWEAGYLKMPRPAAAPHVMLADFRSDPIGCPLDTPSGKIELYSPALAKESGLLGHAQWLAPQEWLGATTTYPLHLITPQPAHRLHGQLDGARYGEAFKSQGREFVDIHPDDARARNIADGQPVRLFNARGSCHAVARLNDGLHHGVLVLPTGANFDPDGGSDRNANPNVLTRDIGSSEMTQGCAAQSCLVDITGLDALPDLHAYSPPTLKDE